MQEQGYVGMAPWMTEWWTRNLAKPPLVIVRCGTGEPKCPNAIGEVKRDGELVMALVRKAAPESEVQWSPLAAPTVEELEADIAEQDRRVLRYVGRGDEMKMVLKRFRGRGYVQPVEILSSYTCVSHGEIKVDTADLAEFVADTNAPKRTYWAAGVR